MITTHNLNIGKRNTFLFNSLAWMSNKQELIDSLPEYSCVRRNILSIIKKFFSSKEIYIFTKELDLLKSENNSLGSLHSRYQLFMDLYNSGMTGAYKALSNFNFKKGRFSSYAYGYCKHEILENYNLSLRQISISLNNLDFRKVIKLSQIDCDSNPICEIDMSTRNNLDYFNAYKENSIQEFNDSEEFDENELDNQILNSRQLNNFGYSDYNEQEHDLNSLLNQLSKKDKDIIKARFFEDKTLSNIAKEKGVSKEAIRKSEKRALKHLKELVN